MGARKANDFLTNTRQDGVNRGLNEEEENEEERRGRRKGAAGKDEKERELGENKERRKGKKRGSKETLNGKTNRNKG